MVKGSVKRRLVNENGSETSEKCVKKMKKSGNISNVSNSSTPKKNHRSPKPRKKVRRSIGSSHFRTLNDHYRKIVRIEHFMNRLGIDFGCEIINCKFTGD